METALFTSIIKAISKNAQLSIWVVDHEMNFTFYNENFEKFYRKNTNSTVSKGDKADFSLFQGKVAENMLSNYKKAYQGEWFSEQITIRVSKHQWAIFEVFFNPIIDENNKPNGIVCIANDISENKRQKEVLTVQNQLLKEIVYVSSHETRLPIANILGISDILSSQPIADEETKMYIGSLNKESSKLDEVVRKIVHLITIYDLQEFMNEEKLSKA